LPAAALVSRQPGRRDARGLQRLLDRQRLLLVPRGTLVDRSQHAGADSREWIELLDRRVRAVRDDHARLEQRAEGVGARRLAPPEAVGEVAVRGRVTELDGGGDAELREARQLL